MTALNCCVLVLPVVAGPAVAGEQGLEEPREDIRRAAERGDAEAQYELGLRLYERINDPESLRAAVEWFTKSAEQGHAGAQFRLGYVHYALHGLHGIDRDCRKAARWFKKAAEQGHAHAMVMLGKCYASGGSGLIQDRARALAWFERAAKLDDAGAPPGNDDRGTG